MQVDVDMIQKIKKTATQRWKKTELEQSAHHHPR